MMEFLLFAAAILALYLVAIWLDSLITPFDD